MRRNRIHLRIFILALLLICSFSFLLYAYADAPPEPITIAGVQYILRAPETFTTQISLLEEQLITLQNSQPAIISWTQSIPQEEIAAYVSQYTNAGIPFTRTVSVTSVTTLALTYSREAYLQGNQFLTGTMTQRVTTIERIVSGGLFPTSTQRSMVQEAVRQVSSGNFQSITPENTIPLAFSLVSSGIVSGSGLSSYYTLTPTQEEYIQNIQLPPEFISLIFNPVTPTFSITPMVTIQPSAITQSVIEEMPLEPNEPEIPLIDTPQDMQIPQPKTGEVVAGAVSSAILLGVLSAVSSAGSSGASALASISSVGMQSIANVIMPTAITNTGGSILSFIRDIINGLRDMFMDEGRAHASGKVTQNFNKD